MTHCPTWSNFLKSNDSKGDIFLFFTEEQINLSVSQCNNILTGYKCQNRKTEGIAQKGVK